MVDEEDQETIDVTLIGVKGMGRGSLFVGQPTPPLPESIVKIRPHRWRDIRRPRHSVPPIGADLLGHTIPARHSGPGKKVPRTGRGELTNTNLTRFFVKLSM